MVDRNFRANPVTYEERIETRWYAVVDDTIGGYAVSNVNKTIANQNVYKGEFEIANFTNLGTAQHIADLHNVWWDAVVWRSYADNIEITLEREYEYLNCPERQYCADVSSLTEDDWFDYDTDHETT